MATSFRILDCAGSTPERCPSPTRLLGEAARPFLGCTPHDQFNRDRRLTRRAYNNCATAPTVHSRIEIFPAARKVRTSFHGSPGLCYHEAEKAGHGGLERRAHTICGGRSWRCETGREATGLLPITFWLG